MQRAFSTFPDGLPGAGLLLLRAGAGVALFVQGAAYLVDWNALGFLTFLVALLTVASGLSLIVGYLTPIAGIFGRVVLRGQRVFLVAGSEPGIV